MVSKVLHKTIVKTFYQANAGFFLVSLALIFGFLKTPQHIDIAGALAHSPTYYLIPLALYILYAIKTLQFCTTARRLPQNQFLSYFILLSPAKRKPLVIYLQALLLAPVLAYSLLLLVVALQLKQWNSALLVVLGNGLLLMISAHFLHNILVRPVDTKAITGFRRWTASLPKGMSMLFLHHLFQRQVMLLLGVKLVSIVALSGFIMIYNVEATDLRYLSLGLLLSAGVNSALAFYQHQFGEQQLVVFKNLPINTNTWFGQSMLSFLILCSPELLVFFAQNLGHVSLVFLLKNTLLPVVLLCFYHALLFTKPISKDKFIQYPFFGTAILFFVILGHVEVLWISLGLLLMSYLIFRNFYRQYSPVIN